MNRARAPGCAADLKFLHQAPQLCRKDFKSKGGPAIDLFAGAPLPKFA